MRLLGHCSLPSGSWPPSRFTRSLVCSSWPDTSCSRSQVTALVAKASTLAGLGVSLA